MAKIFLDASVVIDIAHREIRDATLLTENACIVSALSVHILAYVGKYSCPAEGLRAFMQAVTVLPLDTLVLEGAIEGPTSDLEDNIQLHTARNAGCDYFITSDKTLLSLELFGQMKIVEDIVLKK